ncbi:ferritin family protein [sulfur-oxidizing endosymbiont of Gigantopelta aegis]|uniref:ferritin family protein n=1 Tax=sulfur-oxidizing endosymbiont of Gigantopelta aegis TaxID=2794934 RepID=UPI0018DC5674|nr:ferritin family protein [sulfur-oxidizing endosymbiont of Gigantopelta aegis]
MNKQSQGHVSGKEKLQACTTLQEILEQATDFERTARDFYAALAPKVSKRIRFLVDELVIEEQAHYDLFLDLAKDPDVIHQIHIKINVPSSNKRFSDCIQLPELGENPDDQTILQYALGREQAAMDQYHALAESTPEGPLKDVFVFLAQEETEHKNELEKIYYEVVHSGGV